MAVIFKDERLRRGIEMKPDIVAPRSAGSLEFNVNALAIKGDRNEPESVLSPRTEPPRPALGSRGRTCGHRTVALHIGVGASGRPAALLERRRNEAVDHHISSRA